MPDVEARSSRVTAKHDSKFVRNGERDRSPKLAQPVPGGELVAVAKSTGLSPRFAVESYDETSALALLAWETF